MFFQVAQKGEHHLIQYLISIVMIFVAVLIGNFPLVIALWSSGNAQMTDVSQLYNSSLDHNLMLALIIAPFAFGLLGLFFVVQKIHRRKPLTVITSRPGLDWKRIWLAFGLWFGLNAVIEIVNYTLTPGEYTFRPPGISFFILLVVAFALLPLQIAFEEILFRGYLLQGLGKLFHNRWIPLLLTSCAFGLMHAQNPEVMEHGFGKMMSYYIGIGLILGVIAVMDDGLELSLGIHAATNIYSAVVVSYEGGALQTDALLHSNADIDDESIIMFMVIAILFTFALSKIYKWTNWAKLWSPIVWKTDDSELV
jgi:membrane protease YdiL (CAAX protease family)